MVFVLESISGAVDFLPGLEQGRQILMKRCSCKKAGEIRTVILTAID